MAIQLPILVQCDLRYSCEAFSINGGGCLCFTQFSWTFYKMMFPFFSKKVSVKGFGNTFFSFFFIFVLLVEVFFSVLIVVCFIVLGGGNLGRKCRRGKLEFFFLFYRPCKSRTDYFKTTTKCNNFNWHIVHIQSRCCV